MRPQPRPVRRPAEHRSSVPPFDGDQPPGDGPFDGDQPSGEDPFDVVITGRTRPDRPSAAREVTGAIAAAGATWWLEGFRPQAGERDAAMRRIEAGPPS
jgi:hypothetical protein